MDNFVSNQTLTNEIMSFNLMPENLKKGKILYLYLRELLVEQDKFIYLSLGKTLSNLVCNEDLKEVLCCRWRENYHMLEMSNLFH